LLEHFKEFSADIPPRNMGCGGQWFVSFLYKVIFNRKQITDPTFGVLKDYGIFMSYW